MNQFKVGDKVIRKVDYRNKNMWKFGGDAVTVFRVDGNSVDVGDGNGCFWDVKFFDLLPAEVTVSNETQLPGIPDGYRAVRWGHANHGEYYLDHSGVLHWTCRACTAGKYLIVEPITPPEPPKPKTRSVVLNRYLVWDEDVPCSRDSPRSHRVIVAEEGYVTDNWQNFTLLGHSETIEVEV